MKKHQVSIVIITEKKDLSRDEKISFQRALDVFAEFNKYLIISKDNHSAFKNSEQLEVIKLPKHHFESVNSYSKLLLSSQFYELFSDSEFILIYQLDCYAFHNHLDEFFSYDYVGAPWFETQNHTGNSIIRTLLFRKPLTSFGLILKYYLKHKISAVGNGGFSLRRVDKFIEITKDKHIQGILKSWLKCPRPHEDIFYSFIVPRYVRNFKIADIPTALKFSFEAYPERCYALNRHQLPVGCHAWARYDVEFWKKIFSKYNCLAALFFLLFAGQVTGQSIPVGTPILEDYYRRSQLLGKLDSTVSFTVRPLYTGVTNNPVCESREKKNVFKILPLTQQQQYNTHHPYSLNDGPMIPARGYQGLVSGGIYARLGWLRIQLQPEFVYAENRNFQGFYREQSDYVWAGYYSVMNYIDLPEKFGNGPYHKIFPGQSSVRLTAGVLSVGISSENLWWGPGIRNSFIMSNTATGFLHLTLNTVRPIGTFLGSFEGQLICGRLEDSGYFPQDTSRTYNGIRLYTPKRTNWRYVNAVVLSYHPKWVPGLFLGLTRNFVTYYKDMKGSFHEYFPVIKPFTKKANYGEKESPYPNDQRASVFVRWLWKKENAEWYWEYGREDHAFDLRDLFIDPIHTRAYVLGFQKLFSLKGRQDQYIEFGAEVTQLAQTSTNPERPNGSIYLHYAGISQGYTNQGQLLGAGIGPGSNMQSISLSWVKNLKKIGLGVERYVHNSDFYTTYIPDVRANWVDFTTSTTGEWDYGKFLFRARLEISRSYNYQNLYRPLASTPPYYWDPGRDVYNYQGNIAVTYRF